jgi:hypothetical protein
METVDGLDLQQCQVALPLLGRPDLAEDRVAGSEVEALDLGRRHVDVVGTVQVVPVLTAQEAVPFGQDLQDAFAAQDRVGVQEALFDPEDEVLLPEPGVVVNAQVVGQLVQLADRL